MIQRLVRFALHLRFIEEVERLVTIALEKEPALAAVSCLRVMLAFGQAVLTGLWRKASLAEASQWALRQTPTLRTNG